MIITDGISIGILFIRLGNNGLPLIYNNPNNKPKYNIKYIEKINYYRRIKK
jgi:hypothetical protein